jgi:hypothetical protein
MRCPLGSSQARWHNVAGQNPRCVSTMQPPLHQAANDKAIFALICSPNSYPSGSNTRYGHGLPAIPRRPSVAHTLSIATCNPAVQPLAMTRPGPNRLGSNRSPILTGITVSPGPSLHNVPQSHCATGLFLSAWANRWNPLSI